MRGACEGELAAGKVAADRCRGGGGGGGRRLRAVEKSVACDQAKLAN
jgi:hypothetical protein